MDEKGQKEWLGWRAMDFSTGGEGEKKMRAGMRRW
jgi:hypothetical protein